MIKRILNSLLNILLYPFKLILRFVIRLLKRLKFSIAFKISASYLLIYIIIILIVAVSTSAGCMVFEFQKFERNTINQDVENIKREFPDFKGNTSMSSSIKSFEIYDDSLNSVYPYNNDKRYSDNIIVVLENLLYNREYVYSTDFEANNRDYYLNISYDAELMINDAFKIIVLVLVSGAVGLLIFVPIISNTSYRLIGPIKNMTEITKTITVNNINTRLDVKGTQDELKELSQTFNEMMDRIEQGYKFQQQFVSDASHELRTPIAVIKGYVNMLDRWGKNDKAVLEESIGAIKNETDNMQDLIEKLLFIARSDKGNLAYSKEDFKISTILYEIEKETKMIDVNHKLYFKFYDDANIYGDIKRIKQAIRIIIDNSIKYTPASGYIMVSGFLQDDYYIIKIEDTGIGIEKKDLNKIFDRLYRAEQSRSREIGGHGLGLSIAKIIVLGHKGKIRVKSTIGKGSEFSIMLPYIN
ncbi:HAMP domain-containing histidine kinase [Sedimentibacter hydroxybenzoicus DSM 7310]|uniref:histidine kinase n=1 Tax=Sedimentibacter hydroxybenzoicus DSM 7310 TaxID=1123245 RepID=A0A974GYA2_SEDHY|nr:HAMP domain-containing sensor histidine kinase [Sedimentibacter hydroxybenzoicus]NYB76015.1 HAMP domain-containing histidine kinase [Sedimentibacter hydroxybenzoicus DSM 7310]